MAPGKADPEAPPEESGTADAPSAGASTISWPAGLGQEELREATLHPLEVVAYVARHGAGVVDIQSGNMLRQVVRAVMAHRARTFEREVAAASAELITELAAVYERYRDDEAMPGDEYAASALHVFERAGFEIDADARDAVLASREEIVEAGGPLSYSACAVGKVFDRGSRQMFYRLHSRRGQHNAPKGPHPVGERRASPSEVEDFVQCLLERHCAPTKDTVTSGTTRTNWPRMGLGTGIEPNMSDGATDGLTAADLLDLEGASDALSDVPDADCDHDVDPSKTS
jgi:hypothetical protein